MTWRHAKASIFKLELLDLSFKENMMPEKNQHLLNCIIVFAEISITHYLCSTVGLIIPGISTGMC